MDPKIKIIIKSSTAISAFTITPNLFFKSCLYLVHLELIVIDRPCSSIVLDLPVHAVFN